MKKDKISQVQERFLQLFADGLDTIEAYKQATGNKKVSSGSIRSTVRKWTQKDSIRTRLDTLRKKTDTDKTLRRQQKRELLSDMVKKLSGEFFKAIKEADKDVVTVDDAVIKNNALASADKLAGRVAKLISVDNQMSGDNAPEKVETDITSGGKELTTLQVSIAERINQLKEKKG